ncbi:Hypothetical predicted protein [Lecanosticta acicola]|uniref:Uncharacterized protein n=1 Tax=Lecanosticta acicola TaxID=111012 RepID=A0AAI8Z6U7_9PEZI|nr:Hypothetical predicted protein [Lecanosticta acicola]
MVAFEDLLHDTSGNCDSDHLEIFEFNDFHGGPHRHSGPATADSGVAMSSGYEPRRAEQRQTPNLGTLEAKFEHILYAVEEAGFESFDDLLTQYYTARFKDDTVAYWAQSRSRNRFLHTFLAALHEDTGSWSDREAQGYRQHIACTAERLYVSEFAYAKRHRPMTPNIDVSPVWRAMHELDQRVLSKEYRTFVRTSMPETYALLTEISMRASLQHAQRSQAVSAFLILLLESMPNEQGGCRT